MQARSQWHEHAELVGGLPARCSWVPGASWQRRHTMGGSGVGSSICNPAVPPAAQTQRATSKRLEAAELGFHNRPPQDITNSHLRQVVWSGLDWREGEQALGASFPARVNLGVTGEVQGPQRRELHTAEVPPSKCGNVLLTDQRSGVIQFGALAG